MVSGVDKVVKIKHFSRPNKEIKHLDNNNNNNNNNNSNNNNNNNTNNTYKYILIWRIYKAQCPLK